MRLKWLSVAVSFLWVSTAPAETYPAPDGEVVLTITGDVAVSNGDGLLRFDRAMLHALDATTVVTSTIWTDGVREFQGVSLAELSDLVGASEGVFRASAINDYTVEIPVSDAIPGGPIIAYKLDGQNMSIRDKGPLWVIYPYDQSEDYQSEVIYSRSIWQLDRLHLVD